MPNNEKYRRRTIRKQVDFKPDEWNKVNTFLESMGENLFSPFAHDLILSNIEGKSVTKETRKKQKNQEIATLNGLLTELNRIGVNVNQIAHRVNAQNLSGLNREDINILMALNRQLDSTYAILLQYLNDLQP